MAIPTHEQIVARLNGQQTSTRKTTVLPTKQPAKSSGVFKGITNFVTNYAKNKVTNPFGALSQTIAQTDTAKKLALKIPAVKATKEAIETKSTAPLKAFGKKALSQYNPEGLVYQGEKGLMLNPEVASTLAMPAIGAVGEGASVTKTVASKLAKETSIQTIKGTLKSSFKNLSDDVINRLAPVFSKATKSKEIETLLIKELRGTLPSHEQIVARLNTKVTDELKSSVAKEISQIDTSPLTVNGRPYLGGDPRIGMRLDELKQIIEERALTTNETNEAIGLLEQSGVNVLRPLPRRPATSGGFAKNPFARLGEELEPRPKRLSGDVQNPSAGSDVSLGKGISSKVDSTIPVEGRPVNASTQGIRTGIPTGASKTVTSKALSAQSPIQQVARNVDNLASPESTSKLLQKSIEAGDKTKTINSDVGGVLNTLQRAKTSVLEFLQDSQVRVRQMVNKPGVTVTDASDPYLKASLYSGRVGTRMEALKNETKEVLTKLKKFKVSREELSDYLQARHAPERNAALGDGASGMTTKEAEERLAQFELSPKAVGIKALADKVQEINKRTLQLLKEGGVITDDLFNTLTTKYKNHVPLQRLMDDADDFVGALSGKGFDVKSSGIFTAKGSKRKVADILGNVIYNNEQAILRTEKNLVDQATLNFVRKNKDILGDTFEIIKPRAIGKTFGKDGKPIMEKTNDPSIIQMFENGKKIWIKVKDKKLALALRAVNPAKVPPVLRAVAAFTRMYSSLMTRFNPEFALPNKIRDLQEVMVYLSSQKGVGVKGALGTAARDVKSVPDVIAALRGKDTPGARLYKEMKELGGTTGGMGLSTRKQTELSIEAMEKLANSKTRRLGDNLIGYIDNLNTVFEDSTRLSVYKQALSQGLFKERAAFLAKEASINFNRMGTGGPIINALYMFSNASIQGTVKMLRSLKNPKTLGIVATTVGTSVAAVNEWNDRIDPEWREKVSKWDRLNSLTVMLPSIGDGEDDSKGFVRTSGGAHYFIVPVSWGIKPIKVMADYAYDAASGMEFNARTAMNDLSAAILNAYNPIGGTDFMSAITPTIFDVPGDIERNRSWTGNKIRPDFDPNAPKDIQYYSSLGDTKTGQAAISISEMLQDKLKIAISPADIKYAFDQYVGGVGRTIEKTGNTIAGLATGDVPDLDEFPIVSRFYRSRTEEEVALNVGSSATTAKIKDQLQTQSRDRFKVKNEAEKLYEELKKLPVAEANAKAAELKKTDNFLYVKLKETLEEKKLGLSYTERLMKQLGVTNGERAKFVYEEIMKLPKDKRNVYYADLKTKKVISETVDKQLKQLLKNGIIKQ